MDKFKCGGTYCANEVFFILNFLLFSSYGLCDTETFCTPGDLLVVHHSCLGRLTALTILVTEIIRRNRRQHYVVTIDQCIYTELHINFGVKQEGQATI